MCQRLAYSNCLFLINVRVFKQTQAELECKRLLNGFVYIFLLNLFLFEQFRQDPVHVGLREFILYSAVESRHCSFSGIMADEVLVEQMVHAVVVRYYHSLVSPLSAKEILQQPPAGMGRHTVHLVVGGHHRNRFGVVNTHFKGWHVIIAQHPHGIVGGALVQSPLGLAVSDKVLKGSCNVVLAYLATAVALQSLYRCYR